MKNLTLICCLSFAMLTQACGQSTRSNERKDLALIKFNTNMKDTVVKSDEEWKKELTPEQYDILRNKGTERAFTGKYYHNEDDGTYLCAGCGNALFSSETKFDSGSGWPSFFDAANKEAIETKLDKTHGMMRAEIVCNRCGSHLGHVFDDGPNPTGLRYCVNSASLDFKKKEDK